MVSLTALLTGRRTVSGDVRAPRASQASYASQASHASQASRVKELHFAEEAHPVVAWNVTRACNLACAHCYLSAGAKPAPGELSPEEARALVEDLAAMRVPGPVTPSAAGLRQFCGFSCGPLLPVVFESV